jgi:hypothetical protein
MQENIQDNSEQDLTVENSDPGDFFNELEQQVNGSIVDEVITDVVAEQAQPLATLQGDPKQQAEQPDIWESEENPYKKRYSDSSTEGKRLSEIVKDNEKYSELIGVMKDDPGAAQAVLNHLSGKEKANEASNPRELFGLEKEFVFDMDDALDDPKSQSASVMNNWITTVANNIVENKVQEIETQQQEAAKQTETRAKQQAFMKEKNWTQDQFDSWMGRVNDTLAGGMDYGHLDKIVSEGQKASNIADSTRRQVMNQMKNVSQYPNTVSSANSVAKDASPDDAIFDVVKGVDKAVTMENLFE